MRTEFLFFGAYVCALFVFLFVFFSFHPDFVLLSFDVEPVDGNESVIEILDILKGNDVEATFFILGSYAESYPDVVRRIYEDGHEVACHGMTHKPFPKLSFDQKRSELDSCIYLIKNLTGEVPVGFRAPYNRIDEETFELVAERFDYDASIIDGFSWLYAEPLLKEVRVSSVFFIPLEDVVWNYYLRVPESVYYWMLSRIPSGVSVLFHPHHVSARHLEWLIADLKMANVSFIKHLNSTIAE